MRKVLKASAGTGKTYRLSLEYVIALCKGRDYKNILVMTFTRKATAEIKKEVLEKISNFVEIYNLWQNNEKNIREVIVNSNLDKKKEKNFLALIESVEKISNLKFNREILANLSFIYQDILKNKEKIKIYTIDSFLNIIFKNIIINLMKIKTYSMTDEEDNEYYYKKVLENIFNDKQLFAEFKDFFIENSEKKIDNYITIIGSLVLNRWKYLLSIYTDKNFYSKQKFNIKTSSHQILQEIFNYITEDCGKDLKNSLRKDFQKYADIVDEEELKNLLYNDFSLFLKETVSLIDGRRFAKKDNKEQKEYILERNEDFKESLAKEIYNDVLLPYEKKIIALNEKIYKIYDELKIRERTFTFTDIAIYTYFYLFNEKNSLFDKNGLKNEFFEALDMKIDTIFIDEFQDTSILQWKIIFEIIKKAEDVICVGDEKQSIYGWRGGEKRLFENLDTILEAEYENMNISYRSDRKILDYTNKYFEKISAEKSNWEFQCSLPNSTEDGYVKCIKVDKKEESLVEVLVAEIEKVALQNYSDIAVIARKNKDLKEIANLLEDRKIPYNLNTKNKVETFAGIFEYLELLKYLVYDNELAIFNFISSELSGFGTDEIEVLLKNKNEFLNYLNDIMDVNFENSLSVKIIKFLESIKSLKKEYKKLSAQELTFKIFKIFNFYSVFNKESELKNLAECYLLSKNYVNALEILRAYKNDKIKFSENIGNKNAIELMTIHKSKGLQFKTVFVLNKAEKKKGRDIDFIFSMDNKYENVEFSLFLKNGYAKVIDYSHPAISKAYKEVEEEEKINNLYVALTRAKNNLIIISENLESDVLGELKIEDSEESMKTKDNKNYSLKTESIIYQARENFEINPSKFILATEEKRMLGILIHYFLENIKYGYQEEIDYAIKLCYKNYISYFGEEKLIRIFSKKNIEKIFEIVGDIFSDKWDYIYSEYEIYDYENKKSYRADRIMIKDDDGSKNGEIYIVDYKTGAKNDNQLNNYVEILKKNFGDEIKDYKIRTKFLEFDIEY